MLHLLKRPARKGVLLLLGLSFVLRLLVYLPLHKMQLRFDEREYYKQAVGYQHIIKSVLHAEPPSRADVLRAYNRGGFLPLNSVLLALGFALVSDSVLTARLIMILLGALTTLLVFVTTAKLLDERAAFYAALIHVLYPSFISFSHYLWSETLFILILFIALYLTLVMMDSLATPRLFLLAGALGFCLGLLALTRGSALSFMLFFPAWFVIVIRKRSHKILLPLTILFFTLLTISPWEYVLYKMEKRPVVLSTIGNEYLLYKYNNPFVRKGAMYSSVADVHEARLFLKEHSLKNQVPVSSAAKSLFLEEVTTHFPAFVKRTFENFLQMWTFDFFPLRHIFNLVYPPLPPFLVLFVVLLFLVGPCVLAFLALLGLLARGICEKRVILLLSLVGVGMLPYLITLSHTRYNLPQVALLLPIAGFGATKAREAKHALAILIGICSVMFAVYAHTYGNSIRRELRPSSHYAAIWQYADKVFPATTCKDRLALVPRQPLGGERFTVRIVGEGNYRFLGKRDERLLDVRANARSIPMIVAAEGPRAPLRLEIHSEAGRNTVGVFPLSGRFWHREQEIFPGRLALVWNGGV